jgi:hypothetical protein
MVVKEKNLPSFHVPVRVHILDFSSNSFLHPKLPLEEIGGRSNEDFD